MVNFFLKCKEDPYYWVKIFERWLKRIHERQCILYKKINASLKQLTDNTWNKIFLGYITVKRTLNVPKLATKVPSFKMENLVKMGNLVNIYFNKVYHIRGCIWHDQQGLIKMKVNMGNSVNIYLAFRMATNIYQCTFVANANISAPQMGQKE